MLAAAELLLAVTQPLYQLSTNHLRHLGHGEINHYQRKQTGLSMTTMFPKRDDGICACGCGQPLTGRRRRWASNTCRDWTLNQYWLLYGDVVAMRKLLRCIKPNTSRVHCDNCGQRAYCEIDHIVEVADGGGACGLDNLQCLCETCHKEKTAAFVSARAENRRRAKLTSQGQMEL